VQNLFRQLQKSSPDLIASFSAAFHEMRIRLPSNSEPPFEIHVLLLARGEGLRAEEADACREVEQAIRNVLNGEVATLGEFLPVLESEISLADYFAMIPVLLDSLTYRGEAVLGDEPNEEES